MRKAPIHQRAGFANALDVDEGRNDCVARLIHKVDHSPPLCIQPQADREIDHLPPQMCLLLPRKMHQLNPNRLSTQYKRKHGTVYMRIDR